MKKVLQISSSITGENSVTRLLMGELIAGLGESEAIALNHRDFAAEPIPHLDGAWLAALSTPESDRTAEAQQKVDFSDALIREVEQAEVVVMGLPMYNFSVPSMLKAWIDHITRAGVTFRYTQDGPMGLLTGKKVYLVTAMGGIHEQGISDFLRPYVQLILSFVGLDDVEFITADGLAISPERREQGLAAARAEIEALLAANNKLIEEEEAA